MDNVNAGDALSDWMLHLQARVHLQEVELTLTVDQKLHRTYQKIQQQHSAFYPPRDGKMYISILVEQ